MNENNNYTNIIVKLAQELQNERAARVRVENRLNILREELSVYDSLCAERYSREEIIEALRECYN